MSLYGQYLRERTNDAIIETDNAFATYRYIEDSVYIVDIFVDKDFRKLGIAAALADRVAEIAKEKGCKTMIGTVDPKAKGSTDSLKVLLAYGFSLSDTGVGYIVLRKDI